MTSVETHAIVRAVEESHHAVLGALNEAHHESLKAVMAANDEANEKRDKRTTEAMATLGRRQFGLAVATLLAVIAVAAAATAGLVAVDRQQGRLDDLVDKQADTRRAAILDACRDRNATARGLVKFVTRVSPDLLPLASRTFRVQASCRVYTAVVLQGEPPPRTVAQPLPPRRRR